MSAGVAATGLRVFIRAHASRWLNPRLERFLTRSLIVAALAAASLIGPSAV